MPPHYDSTSPSVDRLFLLYHLLQDDRTIPDGWKHHIPLLPIDYRRHGHTAILYIWDIPDIPRLPEGKTSW